VSKTLIQDVKTAIQRTFVTNVFVWKATRQFTQWATEPRWKFWNLIRISILWKRTWSMQQKTERLFSTVLSNA
jgi:hypothetical protein